MRIPEVIIRCNSDPEALRKEADYCIAKQKREDARASK